MRSKTALALAFASTALFSQSAKAPSPQYTADHKLRFPADYREWIYLSSGLGMSYGPASANTPSDHPPFDNVFVDRQAYAGFLQTGIWPDKTVLILEVRQSQSKGSINNGGHFQGDVSAIEAEVKDSSAPRKWTFYSFDGGAQAGSSLPANASCYGCHSQNGAVDNTFVQFYPTLRAVATQHGTFRSTP